MMYSGTIKFYNIKSKFGFVKEQVTGEEYYFKGSSTSEQLKEGDAVFFELKLANRGKEAVKMVKK